MKKLIIYTDGASRGNPGHASYGFVVFDENERLIHEKGEYIGVTTNNVAEYTAVLQALKYVGKRFGMNGHVNITFMSDSKLVAEQLSGRFKIKSPHLKLIIGKIKGLAADLGEIVYSHVPRSQNIRADMMANKALDVLQLT